MESRKKYRVSSKAFPFGFLKSALLFTEETAQLLEQRLFEEFPVTSETVRFLVPEKAGQEFTFAVVHPSEWVAPYQTPACKFWAAQSHSHARNSGWCHDKRCGHTLPLLKDTMVKEKEIGPEDLL